MKNLKLFFEGNDYCTIFFKKNVKHISVNYNECDFVVSSNFEFGNANKEYIQKSLNKYNNSPKRVIVFLISDYNNELKIPSNVILFRTSIYKSIKKQNEYILPYIWESFYDDFQSLAKTKKPIVGFCGNVKNNTGLRESTMQKIESDTRIATNFIKHIGFGGGKSELIERFKNNILNSHFTICNRGMGNFSIRFYQVLSLGRIPVLLDTDMVFPFDKKINWDSYIIKAKTETQLTQKINNWWTQKNETDVIEVQQKYRQLFEDYFSEKGFGSQIFNFLIIEKNNPKIIKSEKPFFLKFPHLKYKIKKKIATIKINLNKKS
ncbi:TPA: exostosin family protein [Flavobacterium psychrophilum]